MRKISLLVLKIGIVFMMLVSMMNLNGLIAVTKANSSTSGNNVPSIAIDTVPLRYANAIRERHVSFWGTAFASNNSTYTVSIEIGGKSFTSRSYPGNINGNRWMVQFDSRELPEGTYSNFVFTVTEGTESSSTIYTGELIVDYTAPTPPKLIPLHPEWSNADYIDVSMEIGTDFGSGADHVEYSTDYTNWVPYTSPVRFTQEGAYFLYARTVDKAGNYSDAAPTLLRLDRTPPGYPIITAYPDWIQAAEVRLNTPAENSGSPIEKQEYKLSGTVTQDWTLYTGEFVIDTEGTTLIEARATDKAGNVGPIVSQEVRIDRTRPTDPTIKLSHYGWTNQDVSFTIESGTDQLSGPIYPRYQFVGDRRSKQFYGDPIWVTTPGVTVVQAFSQDKAGNLSDPPVEAKVMIDRTNPTAPSLILSESKVTKNNVWVTLTDGSDAESGIEKSQFKIGDAGSWIDYTSPVEVSGEGKTNVYARSIDKAGNVSDETSTLVNIDRTKPTVPLITLSNGAWTNDSGGVTLSINGSNDETPVTYEYRVNNGAYVQGDAASITDEGETLITARAIDEAGNQSDEVTRTVRIDRTKPVITFSPDNPGAGNKRVEIAYKDALSGLKMDALKYKVTRSPDAPVTWDDAAQDKLELQLSDDGEWFVHAKAKDLAGNESESVQKYVVQNLPVTPTNFKADIIEERAITLSWSLPAAGTNTAAYRYEIEEETTGRSWSVDYPTNSKEITGFKGGTEYSFTVRAINPVGQSDPSTRLKVLTYPEAPGSIKIQNAGTSTSSATVSFEKVTSALEYKIEVKNTGGQSIYEATVTENVYQPIRNLTPGSQYTVYVSAVNASGEGAKSNVGYLTLPDIPGQLRSIEFFTNALRLSWQAVQSSESYHLYRDALETYSGDHLQHMDTGLEAGTRYEYQVSAQNSNGEGEKSPVVSAITLPQAVENLRVTSVGNHEIGVSWDGVKGANQYLLMKNGVDAGTVTADTYSFKFDQLNSGSLYTITVIAGNESGQSKESNLTLMTIPSAVTNLNASNIEENTAKIEWSPATGANQYRITVDGKPFFTGQPFMDLTGLDGSKIYAITVEAGNTSGFSEPVKSSFLTKPYAPNNIGVDDYSTSLGTLKWDDVLYATEYVITEKNKGLIGKVTANSIKVDNLQAATEYTFFVSAVNSSGEGKRRQFTWTTPTDKPQNVTYLNQADGTVLIKWDAPAGAAAYILRDSGKEIYRGTTSEVAISGFEKGKAYNLELTALNKNGLESTIIPVHVIVVPKEPSGAAISKVTDTEVVLNFEGVQSAGAGTHFVIERDGIQLTTIPVTQKNYTDAGLTPGSQHTYQIFAKNDGGRSFTGVKVDAILLPERLSGLSAHAIESHSAEISWNQAAGANGYRIYEGKKLVAETKATTIVLDQLKSATKYEGFTIVSFNASGEGKSAALSPFVTKPTSQFGLSIGEQTDHSLKISWDSIDDETAVIEMGGKEVYRGKDRDVTLNNLLPDTHYTYMVWMENSEGLKSQPKVIEGKTLTDDPLKPINVSMKDIKEKSAYVIWEENSLVKKYVVKLNGEQIYSGPVNNAYLSGLQGGQTYTVQVVSENSEGQKSKPVSINFTTKVAMPENLYVHTIGTNEAIIEFDDIQGATGYEYSLNGTAYQSVPSGLSRIELGGLSPDTVYSVNVRGTNTAGPGNQAVLTFKTFAAAGDLYVSKMEPTRVTLKWNVPAEYRNRLITKEEILPLATGNLTKAKMVLAANGLNHSVLDTSIPVDGKEELVDNVVPSKTYKYSLVANDKNDNKFRAEAIVDTLPDVPTGLRAEQKGKDVQLVWSHEGNPIYVLKRNGLEIYRGNQPVFSDKGVPAGKYTYSLYAENKTGMKSQTISIQQEVKEVQEPGQSHEGAESTFSGRIDLEIRADSNQVQLHWTDVNQAYKLVKSGETLYAGTKSSYTDKAVTYGTVIKYQLFIELPDGSYKLVNEKSVPVPYPVPNIVLHDVVERIGDRFIDFKWEGFGNAESYVVYQGGIVVYQGKEPYFTAGNLSPNKTYDFEFAFIKNGVESERAIITVTTTAIGVPNVYPKGSRPSTFTDIGQTFNKEQIERLAQNGVIKGITDTTFEPNRKITRAEFTALIVRGLKLPVVVGGEMKNGFADVYAKDWFISELETALENGIVEGHSPERFAPQDVINREQAAKVIHNILKKKSGKSGAHVVYRDESIISSWALEDVKAISNRGIVDGYEDGTFKPQQGLSRAEAAAILYRLLMEETQK
ncbi:fibronectin type III domain-containing protein [Paenibacillus chitinolyticus]|uniref:fibronectin type III domain-containing protein n=1 Tax=Paenibacillus chitinolyticus TaxID=79263 RepID=UPI001C488D59|nr:fibronectin type III domain-containing protein [Paenibacillus chitinolyticus]MBV6717220.1 fibronectin type III domain-containing protein [Paenibacillus chitinolyticus]